MVPLIDETFVRCLNCGHPYFVEAHELLLRKEPVKFDDDYNRTPMIVDKTRFMYKCAKCGEVLNRSAAAKKAEEQASGYVVTKKVRYPEPGNTDVNPDAGKTTTT